MSSPATDEKKNEEVKAKKAGFNYFVKRPYEDINRMLLGGYKVDESIGENGGIVVPNKQEATRLSNLKGWEWKRVSTEDYPAQNVPNVTPSHDTVGPGTPEKVLMRETYRKLSHDAIKAQIKSLIDNGAPDIALNKPKEKLINYIVRWAPIHGDSEE